MNTISAETLEKKIVEFFSAGYTEIEGQYFSGRVHGTHLETNPYQINEIYHALSPENRKTLATILGNLAVTHHEQPQFSDLAYFYIIENLQTIKALGETFTEIIPKIFNIVEQQYYGGRTVTLENGPEWDLHVWVMYMGLSELDRMHGNPTTAEQWETLYKAQKDNYKWNALNCITSKFPEIAERLIPDIKGKCTTKQYLYAIFQTITHKHKFQEEGNKTETWNTVQQELLTWATEEEWKEEPLMQAYKETFEKKKQDA